MTGKLLLFAGVYSFISFSLLLSIPKGEHGNLLAIPVLLIFWLVAAFLLWLLYDKFKAGNKTKWNFLILLFCTPVPTLVYGYGCYVWITEYRNQTTAKYYTSKGYCIKEIDYLYQDKKEYWSNYDSEGGYYLIDSTVEYNDEKEKYETIIYTDWQRFKGDREQAKCK